MGPSPAQLILPSAHTISRPFSSENPSRLERKQVLAERRSDVLAVRVVNSINSLWAGPNSADPVKKSLPVTAPEFASIRDACVNFDRKLSAEPVAGAYSCFAALTGKASSGYGHRQSCTESDGTIVPQRGEVVSTVVSMIDLPPTRPFQGGKSLLDGSSIVREALPELFKQGDALEVLDPEFISRREEIEGIRTYGDPNVSPGSAGLIELCALLILHEICATASPALPLSFGIRVFTVSKGIEPGPRSQRLVWDAQRASSACVKPPTPPMGSLSAFSQLELEPCDLHVASTDIACFFYALLRLIPNLSSILFLEGASPKAVYRLLLSWLVRARKGEFPEEDIRSDPQRIEKALAANDWTLEVIGCICPAMGWSWSPWLAQTVTNFLARRADSAAKLIVHRGNRVWNVDKAILAYLDDLTLLAKSALYLADLMARVKSVCTEFGLVTHKDQYGANLLVGESDPRSLQRKLQVVNQRIVSLGVLVEVNHLGELYLFPRGDKLAILISATQFLLKKRRVTVKSIERILGHWCWLLQLRRSFYSILFSVYHVILPHTDSPPSSHVFMPDSVCLEFQKLIDLAPLLFAKLTRPLGSRVFMVDAGPEMGAVVWARTCVVSGAKYSSQLKHQDFRDHWNLAFTHQWQFRGVHNNISEGKTIVWACQCADVSSRTVIYSDSLVCIGAFDKGRSSSYFLNRICQKYLAVQLARDLVLVLCYVPSAENFADGPSRGLRFPCVAPSTQGKRATT